MENEQNNPTTNSDTDSNSSVNAPIENRIKDLADAIVTAKIEIEKSNKRLLWQVFMWAAICITILIFAACFIKNHLWDLTGNPYFNNTWTWPVIYFTAIRITVLTAVFTIATFCFKMLRSYIHMYQQNKQKQTLINSMPTYVHAADIINRDVVYNKILDTLINVGSTGIIGDKDEPNFQMNLFELVEKLKEK